MTDFAFVDVHNHCKDFSPDASQPLLERIAEARDLGLPGIILTDHYDKDLVAQDLLPGLSPMGSRPKPGEWIFYTPEYIDRLLTERAALASAGDPFKLLIGVELGYAPQLAEPYRAMIDIYPFDCVLASLHSLEFKDVYYFRDLYTREKLAVYSLYLEGLIQMLKDMDYANILGHFDYISRYAHYDTKKMAYSDLPDVFDELFRIMIQNQVSLELNIGSQRAKESDGTPMGLPDKAILLRYRELGGELVSLGSDAHHAGFVGRQFRESADYLRSLGFRYLTHFEKRQAVHTVM